MRGHPEQNRGSALQRTLAAALGACLASMGVMFVGVATDRASGLTCAITPNGAELAIHGGWPEGAPYDFVIIATVKGIEAEQGDAGTWGEVLTVRVDAVLLGSVPEPTAEVFNAPLGASGWIGFASGYQYLIAGYDGDPDHPGPSTFLCTPNEEITSRVRFDELVSFSASPRVSNTAMPASSRFPAVGLGLALIGLAVAVVARRRMRPDDELHR